VFVPLSCVPLLFGSVRLEEATWSQPSAASSPANAGTGAGQIVALQDTPDRELLEAPRRANASASSLSFSAAAALSPSTPSSLSHMSASIGVPSIGLSCGNDEIASRVAASIEGDVGEA